MRFEVNITEYFKLLFHCVSSIPGLLDARIFMASPPNFPPPQTSEIFALLSQGAFISQNSQQANLRSSFQLLQAYESAFATYFAPLGYQLQAGPGYYFFSQPQQTADLNDKLERLEKLLDFLEILITYQPTLHPGQIIELEAFSQFVQSQRKLTKKLLSLSLRTQSDLVSDRLKALLRALERETLLELTDEKKQTYLVLSAFAYMQAIISRIQFSRKS